MYRENEKSKTAFPHGKVEGKKSAKTMELTEVLTKNGWKELECMSRFREFVKYLGESKFDKVFTIMIRPDGFVVLGYSDYTIGNRLEMRVAGMKTTDLNDIFRIYGLDSLILSI